MVYRFANVWQAIELLKVIEFFFWQNIFLKKCDGTLLIGHRLQFF
jgi:hypothetical protein